MIAVLPQQEHLLSILLVLQSMVATVALNWVDSLSSEVHPQQEHLLSILLVLRSMVVKVALDWVESLSSVVLPQLEHLLSISPPVSPRWMMEEPPVVLLELLPNLRVVQVKAPFDTPFIDKEHMIDSSLQVLPLLLALTLLPHPPMTAPITVTSLTALSLAELLDNQSSTLASLRASSPS
jgi:hypothetical protein